METCSESSQEILDYIMHFIEKKSFHSNTSVHHWVFLTRSEYDILLPRPENNDLKDTTRLFSFWEYIPRWAVFF